MWGEMLFNRSFEPFPPYRQINKMWFDLLSTDENGQELYETDWREFDWYHSGYEHNAWFAAPPCSFVMAVIPCQTEQVTT